MSLSAGTKLGLYEVVGILGVGGMGEVYRARDTKLGREVAVKVLPEALANDPDRIARFEREAKVLASLNHPHIAALYGTDESAGRHFLIMELVEGETIAERLAAHGSRLPVHEVLTIARQIAAALEAAHEKGVVHRDLKPANVKITPDEKVKVLDFGLAKLQPEGAGEAGTAAGDLTNSPTLTLAATQAGVILGTAAYMSPEQAKGRVADKRSDVWSFGCVLYEMLTGKRAFDGEDVSDTLAAVLRSDPDWTTLSADVPAPIRALVQGCLRKDRTQRISDVSTALFLLNANESLTAPAAAATMPARGAVSLRRERVWAAAAVAFFLIAGILAIRVYMRPQPEARTLRFDVFAPEGARIAPGQPLSPDGRLLAFVAGPEGKQQIWSRPLDSSTAKPLLGTDDASGIFWSPDSQFIGFFAHGQLRKVAVTSGMVQTVCNEAGQAGAWSANNVILIGGPGKPLLRVAAAGGQPIPATALVEQETTHGQPAFFPDGQHFLYRSSRGPNTQTWKWYVGSLDSKDRRPLALPTASDQAKLSSSGHVVFNQNGTLMAQAFDVGRFELSGDAFPVVENASQSFSISTTGTLAYVVAGGGSQLVWFDRSGKELGLAGPKGQYTNPELSPDGKQVVFGRLQGQSRNLWIRDIDKGLDSRFTSHPADDYTAVWSPDGTTIAFYSERERGSLWARHVGVIGDDTLLVESPIGPGPADWSRDGHYLVYQDKGNLWALPSPVSADSKPLRVAATSTSIQETSARLSPDGRWIAYQSNQSGQLEVYIQSFPHPGIQQQISTAGGQQPRWSADGKELFYMTADFTLMAVPMAPTGSSPGAGIPMRLFQTRMATTGLGRNYSVAADGRFLINVTTRNQAADPITVVFNWFGELKARAPVR